MSSAFQNRLVGTVIIVALAVIFLPDILDGEKTTHKDNFVNVPARPDMEAVPETEPFSVTEVKRRAQRQIQIVDEKPVDAGVAGDGEGTGSGQSTHTDQARVSEAQIDDQSVQDYPVQPRSTSRATVTAGWVVQLGSFKHRKNVNELKAQLKKAGYRAFTRQVQTTSGELTKVFVGPDLEKTELEKALPHLKELTGLNGKVTTFSVD